jgi:SAM-dependent methyltransferase
MTAQDQINHAAWVAPGGVRWLAQLEGFTDEGERAAFARIAERARGAPILDLGVGGGRTVALLRALSEDYVALDYTPALVEAAQKRHPAVDIRTGDARDLGVFASGSIGLVVFSYMGIDSVSHADRARVLREVRRVLRPGGTFWFSTLNLSGTAAHRRPWKPPLGGVPGAGLLGRVLGALGLLARIPRESFNYLRIARRGGAGPGWAVAPFFAYSYGLLVHYSTLDQVLRELAEAGFRRGVEVLEDVRGALVQPGDDLAATTCFNVLATA